MSTAERAPAPVVPLYTPAQIPAGAPSKIDPPSGEDLITINFGPNHPSTHGVLRLIVTLDGEVVVGLDADIGYVHTGFEKNFEQKTYWKGIPFAPRMDYVAFFANELAYVGAVERLIGIEVPPRAQWIRTLFAELNRIHSHLIYLGTSGVELGAISLFFYCLRERDTVLDLFEMVTGVRMHDRYPQFGGVFEDLPKGFYAEARKFCKEMPKRIDEYLDLVEGNAIWRDRYRGIGTIDADTAIAMGLSGPNLRASGVPYDLRRVDPYLVYDQLRVRRHHRRERRRVRPADVPHQGDVRVGEADRAVPGLDPRRPGDGGRPALRAAAAQRAAHVDGVADPPLQAGHGGLPAAGRRALLRGRVAARGVRLLPGVGRQPQAMADPLPRAQLRQPAGRPR